MHPIKNGFKFGLLEERKVRVGEVFQARQEEAWRWISSQFRYIR